VLIGPLSSAGARAQWIVAVAEPVVLTAFLAWLCLVLYRYLPKALFELPLPRATRSLRTVTRSSATH
jgi:hypothetical protein